MSLLLKLTMMSDVDITLIGDEELLEIIRGLDRQTQEKVLKKRTNQIDGQIWSIFPVERLIKLKLDPVP